ncbi:MAG: sialate O-acetylesterase [Ignavibacteriae bacterium]|nr:sialate O-acetylesterase [Ignavibacteriota bacterium]
MKQLRIILLLSGILCSGVSALANVILPSIFSSGMVLQRNAPIPVWGKAAPGEKIIVKFNGQELQSIVGDDSLWRVDLPATHEGGPYTMTIAGSDTLVLTNVLVGEVWICSGQSNMEFTLAKSIDADKDIPEANHSDIRLFLIKRKVADEPQFTCEAKWEACTPASVKNFSAVAYYFGRRLQELLNVPVGLVQATWGGTPAECWTSREALESNKELLPILEKWREDLARYPEAKKRYDEELPRVSAEWETAAAKARATGEAAPPRPQEPRGPGSRNTPSGQFNAMISPIASYAMKGVIWYQGEANASRAYQYRTLFPAMIADWRKHWGAGDFPFYFVQLPNLKRGPEPSKSGWAELREAQLMTLSLPNTGMAVTIDIGDSTDLHPTNKKPVGLRLARIAEALLYGQSETEYSGPTYKSKTVEGEKMRIAFDHVGGGLVARGNEPLAGFTIAGSDKVFHTAEARIDGDEVVVSSSRVANPVSVRYAWADNPNCNLYNKDGLPASPFRTDDWPEVTFSKR